MSETAVYKPSHPELFIVQFGELEGDFSASLKATKAFAPGETIATLKGVTIGVRKTYTSVQCGPSPQDHLELNSDLVFANHSCEPNTDWDLSSANPAEWHVRASKPIQPGDSITFFYPSTEWDMDQPFNCQCGAPSCLKIIKGAKYLSLAKIQSRAFVNPWIVQLLQEKEARK